VHPDVTSLWFGRRGPARAGGGPGRRNLANAPGVSPAVPLGVIYVTSALQKVCLRPPIYGTIVL